MTKIVFIGGNLSINKGGAALIISAYESIKKVLPHTKFTVTSLFIESDILMGTKYPEIEIVPELKKRFLLNTATTSWIYYLFLAGCWNLMELLNLNKEIKEKIIKTYLNADLIIEISGDGLSGDYGIISTLFSLSRLLTGILLKKKIFIYAQSIGPFNIKWPKTKSHSSILSFICKNYARFVLNRVSLITIREDITAEILKNINVSKTPIYVTADSAFLLNPISKENTFKLLSQYGLTENENLIGISLSNSIGILQYEYSRLMDVEDYKIIMLRIINYIISQFNVKVVLIPHVTGPGVENDDRKIASEIYQKLTNKEQVINIQEELSPNELKGIIGNCEFFIGSRMHANIAAISMAIPTLAIGYSHKTVGIMEMVDQKEFNLDFQELSFDIIVKKLNKLWKEKEYVSKELTEKTKPIKEKTFNNALLVKKLLES